MKLDRGGRFKYRGTYFVYFVVSEVCSKLKIGIAHSIRGRLGNLRCDSPSPLYLLGFIRVDGGVKEATRLEQKFHRWFDPYHSHGEWFEWSDETHVLAEECILSDSALPSATPGESLLRDIFEHHPTKLVSV